MTHYCVCGKRIEDLYDGDWVHKGEELGNPLGDCKKPRWAISRDETGRFADFLGNSKPLSSPVSPSISGRGVMGRLKLWWLAWGF